MRVRVVGEHVQFDWHMLCQPFYPCVIVLDGKILGQLISIEYDPLIKKLETESASKSGIRSIEFPIKDYPIPIPGRLQGSLSFELRGNHCDLILEDDITFDMPYPLTQLKIDVLNKD